MQIWLEPGRWGTPLSLKRERQGKKRVEAQARYICTRLPSNRAAKTCSHAEHTSRTNIGIQYGKQ